MTTPNTTGWEERFDSEMEDCRVVHVYETEQFAKIKTFISSLLSEQKEALAVLVEGNREIHTHDSIPNYTSGLEDGCILCVRNQSLTDAAALIRKI